MGGKKKNHKMETDREIKQGERNRQQEGVYLSVVVIKACMLKVGQSIQLSASTSLQASAKNELPGPGGLLRLPRLKGRNRRLHVEV